MIYYILDQADINELVPVTDCLSVDPVVRGEADICPLCGSATSMLKWLPPHRAELQVFDGYADIVFAPSGSILVSEYFKGLYEDAGLAGLQGFDPVNIVRAVWRRGRSKHTSKMPRYFHVWAVRSRAEIDEEASGVERDPPGPICPECHTTKIIKRWKRVVIGRDEALSEDAFVLRGFPGSIVVSERFCNLCECEGITGVRFIELSQYGHDFYPWEQNKPAED